MKSSLKYSLGWALLASSVAQAEPASDHSAMIILDASGSMWGQIEETAKIDIARNAISAVLEDWNEDIQLGLMAYGHRRKKDCSDIEVLQAISPPERASLLKQIQDISPKGKTPITAALRQAAQKLEDTSRRGSVILMSDGLETCGQSPCEVAAELAQNAIDFKIHVVGFGVSEQEAQQLACIADNTGGKYLNASNATELNQALNEAVAIVNDAPLAPPVPRHIEQLDLGQLSFDVHHIKRDAAAGKTIATGTSNGIGWTVTATNIYQPLSNQNAAARFNDLPGSYDDLHVGSNFSIRFDEPVTSMLVALANDNDTGDGPHFVGLTPADLHDATTADNGTQIQVKDPGGALFYYYDLPDEALQHVNDNGINDGFDLAFFAFK